MKVSAMCKGIAAVQVVLMISWEKTLTVMIAYGCGISFDVWVMLKCQITMVTLLCKIYDD